MVDIPNERQPGDQEYRCTLPDLYRIGPGKQDPQQRQGFYINAKSEDEACSIMQRKFPSAKQIDCETVPEKGWRKP